MKLPNNVTRQVISMMSLAFIFILVEILCENFLSIKYNEGTHIEALFFFFGFGLLQVLFAPLQSALSDSYGRKHSLIVSLSFSLASLALVYFLKEKTNFLLILTAATLFKGVAGNTLPISLALIADTQHKNYRLLFACSTAAYSLAYLLLASADSGIANVSDHRINFYLILSLFGAIIMCAIFLNNQKNNAHRPNEGFSFISVLKREKLLLEKDLRHVPTRRALIAFCLWEISLYVILLSQVDFHIKGTPHIAESMMYGYLLGVVILMLSYKLRDSTVIKIGYYTSFLSLLPYFIFFKVVEDMNLLLCICYFFHALGNAFLSPAFLSILAKESKANQQGRTYGLTDSVDTIAYLCGAVFLVIFSVLQLDVIYLVSFSFLVFTLSWKFYDRFQSVTKR